jgi:hypothetical protein
MVGDVAHGVALDSGTVAVAETAPVWTVTARGTALEGATGRVTVDATFEGVVVGPDTVPCEPRP